MQVLPRRHCLAARYETQRRQKPDTQRNASLEETERSCTMWVATSSTTLAVEQDSNLSGRSLSRLATEKLTEPRVDVDARGHPGLPHTRLDFSRRCGSSARLLCHAEKTRGGTGCSTSRTKASKHGRAREGVGVAGISVQLGGRFGPGLYALLRKLAGYKRAVSKAAGRDGGRRRKLLSVALAKYTATTVLRAQGLERNVVRKSPVSLLHLSGQNHSS